MSEHCHRSVGIHPNMTVDVVRMYSANEQSQEIFTKIPVIIHLHEFKFVSHMPNICDSGGVMTKNDILW